MGDPRERRVSLLERRLDDLSKRLRYVEQIVEVTRHERIAALTKEDTVGLRVTVDGEERFFEGLGGTGAKARIVIDGAFDIAHDSGEPERFYGPCVISLDYTPQATDHVEIDVQP